MPVRAVVSDMRKMHVGRGSPFLISDLLSGVERKKSILINEKPYLN